MSPLTRIEFSPRQFSRERDAEFGIVIVYEDFLAGTRAKATVDRLRQQIGTQDCLKCDMWKFDVLGIPKLNEIAARQAVQARMVIVAAHEGTELPGPVKCWIGDWLLEKDGKPKALVSILDSAAQPGRNNTPVSSYLRRVAEVGQFEFFCHHAKWSEPEVDSPSEQLHWKAENVGPVSGEILRRTPSYQGWGINE